MKTESIRIILNKYKTDHLSEDDAIKLIEDLNSNNYYYPWNTWPQITWNENSLPKYEVTCNHDTK